MAKHLEIGKMGEAQARAYLEAQGYRIAETNWRWGRGEVDIIAWQGSILVFVEVKTRSNDRFGYPEDAVGARKQQLFYDLASEYMHRQGHEGEIRFDIIAITLDPPDLKHFPDAFFPTW